MRATVIITKRGKGYISTASGQHGGGHQGARCGLTPHEAAAHAAGLMLRYGATNPEGASLMAPDEVLSLVPEHLRSIEPTKTMEVGGISTPNGGPVHPLQFLGAKMREKWGAHWVDPPANTGEVGK